MPAVAAVAVGVAAPLILFGTASVLTVVSISIAFWVCASSLLDPLRRLVFRTGAPLTRGQIGMYLAHFGVGVFMLGATVASAYKVELDVSARPGDTVEAGGYEFVFKELRTLRRTELRRRRGLKFELRDEGTLVAVLNAADPDLSSAEGADDGSGDRYERSCATSSSRSVSRSATTRGACDFR